MYSFTHFAFSRYRSALVRFVKSAALPLSAALLCAYPAIAQGTFGGTGDIRVYGDFDGDGKLDYAFFRPTTGTWYVRFFVTPNTLNTLQFGLPGDIPVPADYDGDGITDYAVWRPSDGTWQIHPSSTFVAYSVQFGLNGDIPIVGTYDAAKCVTPGVPAGCITNPKASLVIWRPSNGVWYTMQNNKGGTVIAPQWGLPGDIPVAGDWDGDGKQDLAVWRPSNGYYYIVPSSAPGTPIQKQFGLPGDFPVPANFDLNTAGKTAYGVFRPYESNLYFQLASSPTTTTSQAWGPPSGGPATNLVTNQFSLCEVGKSIYVRIEGDFDGDGKADFAFYRPKDGTWYVVPSTNAIASYIQQWGLPGDIPVAADYDGDGKTDIAVWRPSTGVFYVIPSTNPAPITVNPAAAYQVQWGLPGDIPQLGDFDGDHKSDFAVWRPSTGNWYVWLSTGTGGGAQLSQQFGLQGDIPVAGDFDGDHKTDMAVWRPSTGTWYVIQSSTSTVLTKSWGLHGDLPVAGDFTGDGKDDFAVFRPSVASWLINSSNGGVAITIPLGVAQNEIVYARPPLTTAFITPDLRGNYDTGFEGDAPAIPSACQAH
jgi:FG-GAP-like repeat